ncbi:hypothetical protein K488DRAFT_39805 [Vararia minispora EC-137]|uniref:Uncharacterized protein n=1 Tax=Vararia minispora EC-137 TaxID=1314806 RepID=A0ACB8QZG6_9AGAM|nr:hypothetical protein K488DRAFT_39805 [Vararia minispora EC-137]
MDQDEDAKVELLTAMMGGGDPETTRRVLRKHNGNVDNAAQSLLEGNDALDSNEAGSAPRTPPRMLVLWFDIDARPSKPGIDRPNEYEDVEMTRALRASLEESGIGRGISGQSNQLRPSDRMPDPNWALTTTSLSVRWFSQEEQSLNRAIQESLTQTWDRGASETYTQRSLGEMIRSDERPMALRPTESSLVYAALIIQALYYIPQVRQKLASWAALVEGNELSDPLRKKAYKVVEMFVNVDLAVLSEISADDLLEELNVTPSMSSVPQPPGDASACMDFLCIDSWPTITGYQSIVRVDIRGDDDSSELLVCLRNLLASGPEVIYDASDVIAFHLVRHEVLPSYPDTAPTARSAFRYPKALYLDQFMRENHELATARWSEQQQTLEEIRKLNLRKTTLTHFKGKDVLKDLKSTLHYYENVASKSTPERNLSVEESAQKLRKILARVQRQIESIDTEIAKLKVQTVDLQYDLRAVLVHDGQYGRSHVYSYVQEKGRWWMTTDYDVQEVSDDAVLNDTSGLHYGAGPYMLFYSRALPQNTDEASIHWPEILRVRVFTRLLLMD